MSTGPLRSRSSSGVPTSASSAAICWLIADCETKSVSAAAENEPLLRDLAQDPESLQIKHKGTLSDRV